VRSTIPEGDYFEVAKITFKAYFRGAISVQIFYICISYKLFAVCIDGSLSEISSKMPDIIERLIVEVEKHPILYDKSLQEYKDTDKKDRVWKEVSDKLNLTGKSTFIGILKCLDIFAETHFILPRHGSSI
jgi:hypothetical protein